MNTITSNNFTKELFCILNLEWNEYAKARHLLSSIIDSEEAVETIIEDTSFCFNQFLDYLRVVKNVSCVENGELKCFITLEGDHYLLNMGNEINSQVAFAIVPLGNSYLFQRGCGDNTISQVVCNSLDTLKRNILHWFEEFYKRVKEGIL